MAVKRAEVEAFFLKIGIEHSERVEFTPNGYTVWSYRRDEQGQYMLNPCHANMPIFDVHNYLYEEE
jgi:hypothetical protein